MTKAILVCDCQDMAKFAETAWQVVNQAEHLGDKTCPEIYQKGTFLWNRAIDTPGPMSDEMKRLSESKEKFAKYYNFNPEIEFIWDLLTGKEEKIQ